MEVAFNKPGYRKFKTLNQNHITHLVKHLVYSPDGGGGEPLAGGMSLKLSGKSQVGSKCSKLILDLPLSTSIPLLYLDDVS